MSLKSTSTLFFILFLLTACSTDSPSDSGTTNVAIDNSENDDEEDTSSDDESEENIFVGDLILTSQEEVDEIGAESYTRINGNVVITYDISNPSGTTITSLTPLDTWQEIDFDLSINYLPDLINLDGFGNIHNIGGSLSVAYCDNLNSIASLEDIVIDDFMQFRDLPAIENLPAFNNVEILKSLIIESVANLKILNGFENVKTVSSNLVLRNNYSIESITAFSQVKTIGNLSLTGNFDLTSISNFSNLEVIEDNLTLGGNGITNLDFLSTATSIKRIYLDGRGYNGVTLDIDLLALNNLTQLRTLQISHLANESLNNFNVAFKISRLDIRNCPNLTSLDGFENLLFQPDPDPVASEIELVILENENLTDLCGITNIVTSMVEGYPEVSINILENGYDPFIADFYNGNCSL